MGNGKKLFYALMVCTVLFLLSEAFLRILYFQTKASSPLAWITVIRTSQTYIESKKSEERLKLTEDVPENVFQPLFQKEGAEVLEEVSIKYESHFKTFIEMVQTSGSKLIVLYIPSGSFRDEEYLPHRFCRKYFSELCAKYGLELCDCTNIMLEFRDDELFLLPLDGHLSRFGNKQVVAALSPFIEKYGRQQNKTSYETRPTLFGDLLPNNNTIWGLESEMPYRVRINSQGLRMNHEVTFPKTRQRILILGDSFTFGPFLNVHDVYPELLQQKYPDREFLNAGKAGYTITDEESLFSERAIFTEPDITILQVLDNDLFGLMYFKLIQFDRKRRIFEPTQAEKRMLDILRLKNEKVSKLNGQEIE